MLQRKKAILGQIMKGAPNLSAILTFLSHCPHLHHLGTHYPFSFGLQSLHIMHTNTKRVQTTFVIDIDFCPGGRAERAQFRILACMY